MSNKKGRALADELMDDLLNDGSESGEFDSVDVAHTEDDKTHAIDDSTQEIDSGGQSFVVEMDADPMDKSDFGQLIDSRIAENAALREDPSPPTPHDDQRTQVFNSKAKPHVKSPTKQPAPNPVDHISGEADDRVRASVGRFAPFRSGGGPTSSTEAALAQSESLRIAQNRMLEFEQEVQRLRTQNEELAAAAETLRRRTDELTATNQKRESDYQYAVSTFEQEKKILIGSKEGVQRELDAIRQRNEELELRISTNIQKIRVRERELENRLELLKMESAALIRSKDEMILELKRNIDQIGLELSNYRSKNQELNRQSGDRQEQLRRTVKALRLALSMLEGEEESPKASAAPIRKAK